MGAETKIQPSGSIPAQAGEPRSDRRAAAPRGVYPRAGGGTIVTGPVFAANEGLSPRRRGNPARRNRDGHHRGSIPAQAGEPVPAAMSPRSLRVYPRAGGGTGTPPGRTRTREGLSPRRRGNRRDGHWGQAAKGSIPAQAGEPRVRQRLSALGRVYPRAGGGTLDPGSTVREGEGLSPRRRGNLLEDHRDLECLGSIPAQAGEPSSRSGRIPVCRVYPRAGGGTRTPCSIACVISGLSPRRRGNHRIGLLTFTGTGSIPAQAGNPGPGGVHLRPGGSIPAQAGEPCP